MKIKKKVLMTLAMAFIGGAGQPAKAQQVYEHQVLGEITTRIEQVAAKGGRPLVIFDLDDTLINTRERNLRIFRELSKDRTLRTEYLGETKTLSRIGISKIKYAVKDTLNGMGISNAAFIQRIQDLWVQRFFSNEYCRIDQVNEGAVKYTKSLERAGATIIYLTGRDTPRMGAGTRENLLLRNFPLNDRALLMMKPNATMDDLAFKIEAFETIAAMGQVVAAFENEPANINALQKRFPTAAMVFLDTIHSPRPDVPNPGVKWVQNFLLRESIAMARAKTLACREAARVNFDFDTACEEDFYEPGEVSDSKFSFFGVNSSGDCGIRVDINRFTGEASSEVDCY